MGKKKKIIREKKNIYLIDFRNFSRITSQIFFLVIFLKFPLNVFRIFFIRIINLKNSNFVFRNFSLILYIYFFYFFPGIFFRNIHVLCKKFKIYLQKKNSE